LFGVANDITAEAQSPQRKYFKRENKFNHGEHGEHGENLYKGNTNPECFGFTFLNVFSVSSVVNVFSVLAKRVFSAGSASLR